MEVFHYLANELVNEPLFESSEIDDNSNTGAVYNDFDYDPMVLLHTEEDQLFCFSQPSNINQEHVLVNECTITQEGMEHAIIEADRRGEASSELVFDCPFFDIEGNCSDSDYLEKVFKIASGDPSAWKSLRISETAEKVFSYRFKNEWKGADTVYDAWLLLKGMERSWFDYKAFYNQYPDFSISRGGLRRKLLDGEDEPNVSAFI